ncbi:pancreatic lipase-related protein 2-like isoform X2 [Penaeus japonicus]|uniref:pancreatic lipase-related protein 2-like isoform X2 n=1 Tax=Penaeus japonicus TaxID=27405 RepID=UPI001C716057|nr:pancreatic lipase-related protein 2-like isoform X2 [Penaeus japonicus]
MSVPALSSEIRKVMKADDIAGIYSSDLDASAPLYVITHGYLESARLKWMQKMMTSLLRSAPKVGVVTVDWARAAPPPYAQAVANIRLVGAATGYLLHVLAEFYDVSLRSVHLVGHSLGAHLMGYAGQYVWTIRGEKVGRVTGLDPAGPYFTNTPPEVRLDPSDADFVDIIHTDMPREGWQISKLGHPDPIGHVDFYPNGGALQAGCQGSAHSHIENDQSVAEGVLSYIGCNHQRSHEYFTESVSSRCRFMGVTCDSWEEYLNGSCWGCGEGQSNLKGRCLSMGFFATPLTFSPDSGTPLASGAPQLTTEGHSDSISGVGISSGTSGDNSSSDSTSDPRAPHATEVPATMPGFPVKVFLGTTSQKPFCAEQYRITVVTSPAGAKGSSDGDFARFTVGLHGLRGVHPLPPPERPSFVEAGDHHSWVRFSSAVGRILSLRVFYEEENGMLHSLIWRFSRPHLYVEAFTVEELSSGEVTRFPFCGEKMEAGDSHTLYPDRQCPSASPVSQGETTL